MGHPHGTLKGTLGDLWVTPLYVIVSYFIRNSSLDVSKHIGLRSRKMYPWVTLMEPSRVPWVTQRDHG